MNFLLGLLDIKSPTDRFRHSKLYKAGATVRKVVKRFVRT